MATFTSKDAIGAENLAARTSNIREDLANVIYDISPVETPFISAIKKTTASNIYHEWLTDSLAAPNTNNAQVFGADPTSATLTPRTRVGNYVQLLDKMIQVSDEQNKVDVAGMRQELAYQVAKGMKELKRDLEAIVLQANQAAQAPDPATNIPSKMASVGNWIATNVVTNVTPAVFTETMLQDILQQVWDQGGDVSMVILSSAHQRVADGFSGSATRFLDVTDESVTAAVRFYATSLGEVTFYPDRFGPADTIYVLDPDYWAIAQLGALKSTPLAKTGHSEKRLLSWYVTLEARNEKSSGKITNVTG